MAWSLSFAEMWKNVRIFLKQKPTPVLFCYSQEADPVRRAAFPTRFVPASASSPRSARRGSCNSMQN